jgi:proline racemase
VQPEPSATQPIIRTYRGAERRAAELAYRADAQQAATAGWVPVAHRWSAADEEVVLAVVFEHRPAGVLDAPVVASAPAAPPSPAAPVEPPAVRSAPESLAASAAPKPEPLAASAAPELPAHPAPAPELPVVPAPESLAASAAPELLAASAAPELPAHPAPAPELPVVPGGPEPGASVAAGLATGEADEFEDLWSFDELVDAAPVVPAAAASVAGLSAGPGPEAPPATPTAVDDDHAPIVYPADPDARSAARASARAILQTLDLHCAGEPLRLIRTGYPQVPDAPILERRRWVAEHADWARRALMFEPRGHRDMYGAILLPPHDPRADIAVLFMHNEGYSTMCGHGIIALTTGLIEERLYAATEPETVIRFETPAGLVTAVARVAPGEHGGPQVQRVRFVNVPSWHEATGIRIPAAAIPGGVAPHVGDALTVDVAFGGAYYGIVDAADLGLRVVPASIEALTRAGAAITDVLRRDHTPRHPTDPDLGFIYGAIVIDSDPASSPDGLAGGATIRNVTVFADAEVDRSPCGSGTSAVLAAFHGHGRLPIGASIVNASITGESFEGRLEGRTTVGDRPALVTSVSGIGYVTGYGTFLVDARDPLGAGFLLR